MITSRHGSLAEIAEGGGCLMVDPYDLTTIEDAMRNLLHDDGLLEGLRAQARDRHMSTWAEYADAVWSFLVGGSRVVSAGAPPGRRARSGAVRRASRALRRLGQLGLRRSPEPLLVVIAARVVAPTATLELVPGWSFASAERVTGHRARARRALWAAFRDRRIRRPVTIVWYEGLRVRLFLGNDLSLCLYVGGSFEPNEFVLWRSVLEPGMVFVDCGANDGLHSLFAARRVGDTGRVIAVEPSSREHERLMANLRVNELENVTTARVALGASPGVATLAIAGEGHEVLNTIGVRVSNPNVEAARHERVDVRTLDDLVSTLGLGRVDVIKLDVEGSELHVLEGARSVIARHRPLLLLEVEEERLASQGTHEGSAPQRDRRTRLPAPRLRCSHRAAASASSRRRAGWQRGGESTRLAATGTRGGRSRRVRCTASEGTVGED